MFGAKRKRYKEIETEFMHVMTLLGSGGDERAFEAANSLQVAMDLANQCKDSGFNNNDIVRQLARASMNTGASTSGTKLAFRLVALIYECREVNTSSSLRLASNIQDIVYDAIRKFSSNVSSVSANKGDSINQVDQYEVAIEVLIKILAELQIFNEYSGRLYRSHALGFIWGWCDANTQMHSKELNTDETLEKCTTAVLGIILNIEGITQSEAEDFLEALIEMRVGNDQFELGLLCGGQALFDLVNKGDTDKAIEDIALVFGPEAVVGLQALSERYGNG